MTLGRYASRRVALGLVQVLVVLVAVFLLVEALPGDAAVALAGDNPDPARVAAIRASMGLDQSAVERFVGWLGGVVTGDLGTSLVSGRPVAEFIAAGLPTTLLLAGVTLLLLVPSSVLLGVFAACRAGRGLDRVITAATIGLHAVPEFALAIVLVALFGVTLGWLPPTALGADPVADPLVLVLPVIVLLARPLCALTRLVRAAMIDALASDYVRHARRLGLSRTRVDYRHALPNALAPAVQQLARTTDWLLGGVIVVEAVFVIPGLGTSLVDAVAGRDMPVVQGLAVLFGVTTVLVNLAADLLAFRLAPRAGTAA